MRRDPVTSETGPSLEDLADGEKLAALRPSHRLCRAHPALGLEEADGRWLPVTSLHELGTRWLSLEAAEQRARETDFLRGLLRVAARYEGARFEAGWSPRATERAAALAQACAVSVTAEATARGPLTAQAIEVLAGELPNLLVVDGGPGLTVVTLNGWGGLGVWTDHWRRDRLQRELEESWWPAAQERSASSSPGARRGELDRTVRAHVLIAWDRYSYKAFIAAMAFAGLVGLQPWGDRSVAAVALRLAVAVVVLIALGRLVERWYHRSQRESD